MKYSRKSFLALASLTISISVLVPLLKTDAQNADIQNATKDVSVNGVVTHMNTDPPHEWTMEEMLLAEPMPMSAEGRGFASGTKQLQTIRDWSLADFEKYVGVAMGKQHAIETATRWMGLRRMLRTQIGVSKAFLSGKPPTSASKGSTARSSPAVESHPAPGRDIDTGTDSTGSQRPQPGASSGAGGSAPGSAGGSAPGSAGGSAPGSAGGSAPGSAAGSAPGSAAGSAPGSPGLETDNPFEPASLSRYKHLSIQGVAAGDFVVTDAAFSHEQIEKTFNDLKECRQNISDLCRQLEKLKADAKRKKQDKKLDWLLSSYEYR
jgi:hypothetical protein